VLGEDRGVKSVGAGSGGAWETPLVSGDGSVTFGIGNPYQSAASAIADRTAQRYTDSDVNLDASTGRLIWKRPSAGPMGHQAAADAAGRRHGLERSRLHNPLRRGTPQLVAYTAP
jgi:hypothetical protein